MAYLGWLLMGLIAGSVGTFCWNRWFQSKVGDQVSSKVLSQLRSHFHSLPLEEIAITERQFPARMRADIQRALDRSLVEQSTVLSFYSVGQEYSHGGTITLSGCLTPRSHNAISALPPEYEEVEIGEESPIRVLKNGLWLIEREGVRMAVLVSPTRDYCGPPNIQIQVAIPQRDDKHQVVQKFFAHLEEAMRQAASYRGKILSLESKDSYDGTSVGIKVHRLQLVERDQVILPEKTLALLDRNVIQFVQQRPRLAQLRQSTKKGILFYGPPGTGKTHTIHYLAKSLPGHTTFLITAEQVGQLSDYMALARLLQPSIVVMEDVDLIARDRNNMGSVCEEVLLNKLLNEMDGLTEKADILFLLTTNRPESLETALASRPGRIDQAIEFPAPDEIGRAKLIKLYSKDMDLSSHLIGHIAGRTEGVSAAFIKELMRRTLQFHLEHNQGSEITQRDVDAALDEMLFSGGTLNLKLLGTSQAIQNGTCEVAGCN
jgi:cell division protease FtsH